MSGTPPPYTAGSVYYFKPTVTSVSKNWTPSYLSTKLSIPYSGLYMIQMNVGGSQLNADLFISKNMGDGSELVPSSSSAQVLAMNSINSIGLVTATTYLSNSDVLSFGCILQQTSLSLSSNKCWLSITLLQQTA